MYMNIYKQLSGSKHKYRINIEKAPNKNLKVLRDTRLEPTDPEGDNIMQKGII